MNAKKEFEEVYTAGIRHSGSRKSLGWLSTTDSFTAPAGIKLHCACLDDPTQRSVNICRVMREKHFEERKNNGENFTICGLLHDVRKAQYYRAFTKSVRNEETGTWERRPFYMVEDSFPYGHEEEPVLLIECFLRLKPAEVIAIRWHMGDFDGSARSGNFAISLAYQKYPITVKLRLADLESTYLREKGTSSAR